MEKYKPLNFNKMMDKIEITINDDESTIKILLDHLLNHVSPIGSDEDMEVISLSGIKAAVTTILDGFSSEYEKPIKKYLKEEGYKITRHQGKRAFQDDIAGITPFGIAVYIKPEFKSLHQESLKNFSDKKFGRGLSVW